MSCVVVPQSASGSGRTVITLSRRMAIVTVASEERGRKSGGKNSLVEEGRGIGMCRWGGARQDQHSRTHLVSYLAVAQLRLRLGPGSQKLKPQLVENKNNLSAC